MSSNTQPDRADYFGELSQALVEQLVEGGERLGQVVTKSLERVKELRDELRNRLQSMNLLNRIDDLPLVQHPTTCGVDGAYGVEPLIGCDLVVIAGLATEGLTPPTEKRHWEEPHFGYFINVEPHREENRAYARALMITYELEQAAKAPHDVVFLDGSFLTPITALHQALSKDALSSQLEDSDESSLPHALVERASAAVQHYHLVLSSERSDKAWVSVPKYTTKREIGKCLGIAERFDDRALCSLILKPGEFVGPVPMEQPSDGGWQGYFLIPDFLNDEAKKIKVEVEQLLKRSIHVVYFRAAPSNPALRLEVPQRVAQNRHRLATVLQAVRSQSALPGILEPQPLYYADRMAKSLSIAVPSLREMLARFCAQDYSGDISDVFFVLHGYRTEGE